jgi:hypothetical protein
MPERKLHRYWIEVDPAVGGLRRFGVTAFDLDDALTLISETYGVRPRPSARNVVADVDVDSLDANHVLPNIGPPIFRGVWYPRTSLQGLR